MFYEENSFTLENDSLWEQCCETPKELEIILSNWSFFKKMKAVSFSGAGKCPSMFCCTFWPNVSLTLTHMSGIEQISHSRQFGDQNEGRTVCWCRGQTKSQTRGLGCCLASLSTAFNMTEHNSDLDHIDRNFWLCQGKKSDMGFIAAYYMLYSRQSVAMMLKNISAAQ